MLIKEVAREQERLPELVREILRLIVDQLHDRASRSSRVTISTSPGPSAAIARRSCRRSVLAPDAGRT